MPTLVVETPEGIALRYDIAGAGSRTAAALIDLLLFGSVWLAAVAVLLLVTAADVTGASRFLAGLLIGGILLLPAVYQIAFGILGGGRTPGKRLLGLYVADAQGYPATALQHVLRGLFWPLEAIVLVLPLPVALVLIVATERRQRLGDLVAGTVVLRETSPRAAPEPFARESWSRLARRRLVLVPAHAAQLDGDDLEYLRALLGRLDLEEPERGRLLRASARHYVERLGLDPGLVRGRDDARQVLREIFLFLREARGRAAGAG